MFILLLAFASPQGVGSAQLFRLRLLAVTHSGHLAWAFCLSFPLLFFFPLSLSFSSWLVSVGRKQLFVHQPQRLWPLLDDASSSTAAAPRFSIPSFVVGQQQQAVPVDGVNYWLSHSATTLCTFTPAAKYIGKTVLLITSSS